jgi:hypothetical protein
MKTTAVKSLAFCSGLLMVMACLGVECFAQSQGQEQQPVDTAQAAANEPGAGPEQSGKSEPALSTGNLQGEADEFRESRLGLSLLKNISLDQKAMWTSPMHLRLGDANWLVPLAGVTTASLASDTGLSKALTHSPSTVSRSSSFSNYGIAALGGITGGMYLWGKMTHDDHRRKTGLLSGEAVVDAVGMTTVLHYAFGRQRPSDGNGGGGFWHGGTSFPSDHSAAAWAAASVIAHEYPGPLTKLLVYGLASAVSISRVTGRDHFPTDALIGGGIGWLVGRHVYLAHHDPELGGSSWGLPFKDDDADARETGLSGRSAASTFVPLDSWVYPAFDRLAAMGYVTTALQGMKPWTRIECARLTAQAGDALLETTRQDVNPDEQAVQLQEALKREFAQEIAVLDGGRNLSLAIDSVYTRAMSISGPILTDGFNFGQTISYDFGRPFRRGTNAIAGTSLRASEGPLAIYVRVEYQHSPSAPPLSGSVLQFISTSDGLPLQAPHAFAPVNRADLLEGYVSFSHHGWQVSAGKQAMSWGIGEGGAMLLSNNAEPLKMIRLTRTIPAELPGFFRHFGKFRTELFVAKLDGGLYVPHRLMWGQKISFNVTPYFEMGWGRTVILGRGANAMAGDAFTTANFFNNFLARKRPQWPGGPQEVPGDSRFAFDFNFDPPWLKHAISIYGDLFTDDLPIYMYNPTRGAYRFGIFIPRLPHLSRADFRSEATSSESPDFEYPTGGLLNYYNSIYRDGYTNDGQLMGNTVGRQGRMFQQWITFHLSALHEIQFSFTDHQVPHMVPGGGLWQDYTTSYEIHFRSGLYVKSRVQFEHIQHYPILFNGQVNNVSASIELGALLKGAKF